MSPLSSIQAGVAALIVNLGNAAVAFGALNNTTAAVVETAVIGVVSLGFLIANAIHAHASANVTAARVTAGLEK